VGCVQVPPEAKKQIESYRAQLTDCASGNVHVPSRTSGRGRKRRTV
jgi:hypothetical protein